MLRSWALNEARLEKWTWSQKGYVSESLREVSVGYVKSHCFGRVWPTQLGHVHHLSKYPGLGPVNTAASPPTALKIPGDPLYYNSIHTAHPET